MSGMNGILLQSQIEKIVDRLMLIDCKQYCYAPSKKVFIHL